MVHVYVTPRALSVWPDLEPKRSQHASTDIWGSAPDAKAAGQWATMMDLGWH